MRWMVAIGRVSQCWERQSSLRSAEDALDLAFESGERHVHVQRHGDGRVPGLENLLILILINVVIVSHGHKRKLLVIYSTFYIDLAVH